MSFIISNIHDSGQFQKVKCFVFFEIPALFRKKILFELQPPSRKLTIDKKWLPADHSFPVRRPFVSRRRGAEAGLVPEGIPQRVHTLEF